MKYHAMCFFFWISHHIHLKDDDITRQKTHICGMLPRYTPFRYLLLYSGFTYLCKRREVPVFTTYFSAHKQHLALSPTLCVRLLKSKTI